MTITIFHLSRSSLGLLCIRKSLVVVEEIPGRRELREEELVGEGGGVDIQQREELAGQKEELGWPASHPLSQPQSEVHLRHPATLINDEHRHTLLASRNAPAQTSPSLGSEAKQGKWEDKRRRQDERISSEIPHSEDSSHEANEEDNEDDEDPRPTKPRKLPLTPTDNALTPPDKPTLVDNDHHYTLRTSLSPSITVESAPVAEYQECPFQGFLKRTKIENEITYYLEFQLSHVPEHLHPPILSEALGICSTKETSAEAATPHNIAAHSKVQPATLWSKRKRVPWKLEEHETIHKMKEKSCSWESIHHALPHRTLGAIQVQYSTKLKK